MRTSHGTIGTEMGERQNTHESETVCMEPGPEWCYVLCMCMEELML